MLFKSIMHVAPKHGKRSTMVFVNEKNPINCLIKSPFMREY